METWCWSDGHFEHDNIIEYCGRPFVNKTHMRQELVRRWNKNVAPEDTVYVLGDFAMGKIDFSLKLAALLNGHKRLILGNHDRPFPTNKQSARWFREYARYFEDIRISDTLEVNGMTVELNHFPYQGDSHENDRYEAFRPLDRGNWLLHGHTHSPKRLYGERMIHVGVDAWDFRPAHIDEIATLIEENS